ncbi:MAG: DUF1653 domain-containing protein [Eubacteriales bacterium]|nr:DUF1653 domain-containing protein [Eubacteriales bacterium]
MARKLVIGGFYRHFKNKMYQVKGTAIHSESKEKMVIYQGLYGAYETYVRPYDMFLSEVDHEKYPEVFQKYRFELVDIVTGQSLEADSMESSQQMAEVRVDFGEPVKTEEDFNKPVVTNGTDSGDNSKLVRFLDASEYKDKLDILTSMRNELTDDIIDVMAESIEVAVNPGTIDERYDSLRKCLLAHTKYEGTRLRS